MSRLFLIGLITTLLVSCKEQINISGPLNIPDALFTYSAEGNGIPMVIFTGGENLGQNLFPHRRSAKRRLRRAGPGAVGAVRVSCSCKNPARNGGAFTAKRFGLGISPANHQKLAAYFFCIHGRPRVPAR